MKKEYPALSEEDKQLIDTLTREQLAVWDQRLQGVIDAMKQAGQSDGYHVLVRCKNIRECIVVRTGQLMAEQLANPNKGLMDFIKSAKDVNTDLDQRGPIHGR